MVRRHSRARPAGPPASHPVVSLAATADVLREPARSVERGNVRERRRNHRALPRPLLADRDDRPPARPPSTISGSGGCVDCQPDVRQNAQRVQLHNRMRWPSARWARRSRPHRARAERAVPSNGPRWPCVGILSEGAENKLSLCQPDWLGPIPLPFCQFRYGSDTQ
jgi:hypothetical protein